MPIRNNLETFRNCLATDIFYYWFDNHSNPPPNFRGVTSGSQLNLTSESLSRSRDDENKPEKITNKTAKTNSTTIWQRQQQPQPQPNSSGNNMCHLS